MMRHYKLTASSLIAGAALALTACGGGGTANNTADNAVNGFDNSADPGAVETLGNGTEGGNGALGNGAGGAGSGTGSGTSTSNGSAGNSGAGSDSGTAPSGTNPGGDAGGNAAGGTNNEM